MSAKSDKPRVAHVTTVHHPFDPRIFHKEVQSLRQAGFEVHLIAQHPRSEVVDGVPITALSQASGRSRRLLLLREAYQTARALHADLYHLHDPELIPIAFALKRATGARVVYDMHEDYGARGGAEGRLLRALERWCFTWADHVVLAEEGYRPIAERARVPHTAVLNYFRPYATVAARSKPPPQGSLDVLYAGVQAYARGLGTLLDVASQARRADLPLRLHLVGACYRRRDREAAEKRIAAEQLENIVHQAGWAHYLPWQAMEPYFLQADVGAALLSPLPNYTASIPTKFYEYLHYGLPILCSDFPAWRAFVERHGCGAAVDPGRPDEVLRVLRRWYEEPEQYAELSARAASAAPQYHWAQMETRLVGLYRRLLSAPPRS